MEKYSLEIKLKIVEENLKGYGTKKLSKKYQISRYSIREWCDRYEHYGIKGLEPIKEIDNYSGEFKLSVIQYRQEKKLTYKQTAAHFKIKRASTIRKWQYKYRKQGISGFIKKPEKLENIGVSDMAQNKTKKLEKEEIKRLKEENEYLRAENLYLKKLEALTQKNKTLQTKKKQK